MASEYVPLAGCGEIGCENQADLVLCDSDGVPFPLGTYYGRVVYIQVCEKHRKVAEERAEYVGMRIGKDKDMLQWRPKREVRL